MDGIVPRDGLEGLLEDWENENDMLNIIRGGQTYQVRAMETAEGFADPDANIHDGEQLLFLTVGLNGETGEFSEKLKKATREEDRYLGDAARKEVGDICWYLAAICEVMDWNLGEILAENLEKLEDRQERGVVHDEGDER